MNESAHSIEQEMADSIREACDGLNQAIETAASAALTVSIHVDHVTEHGDTAMHRPVVAARITRVEEL